MKTVILLLCLLGTALSLPVRQAGTVLPVSNSREILQLMRLYNSLGNIPQQTQQQVNPGLGLPPAQLLPDQTPLLAQQANQVFPALNFIPLTRVWPFGADINLVNGAAGGVPITQTLPIGAGGVNTQHLVPQQGVLPLILGQMGPQGLGVSSEEMQTDPQILTGLILLGLQGLLQANQAVVNSEGQDIVFPAGQTHVNQASPGQLPSPEGTADVPGATLPAGIKKGSQTPESITEAASGVYTTPPGFRQLDSEQVTDAIFAEPAILLNLEANEIQAPPTSDTGTGTIHSINLHTQGYDNKIGVSPVRGDRALPLANIDVKALREYKSRSV
ncbi:PREDICTED: amelotin [Crocodylus porosus]|uniref:Amelotin n=1 Tax=Crocodylus porosus TaxID=8502 RepID=A0A7M4F8L6_CROPO|nr:PREDICTED: amelotin [Crocodylus porosus]